MAAASSNADFSPLLFVFLPVVLVDSGYSSLLSVLLTLGVTSTELLMFRVFDLVESILLEAESINKVIVVYSGRFQPFHKGHYATYDNLVKKFGKDNVYIGTSNVTDSKKSPFNFNEKVKIMNTMFGIPTNKIVQVKNPYAPKEILLPLILLILPCPE